MHLLLSINYLYATSSLCVCFLFGAILLFGDLQALIVQSYVQLRMGFPYDISQLRFQIVHLDAGYLAEQRATEWCGEGQNQADQSDLEWRVGPWVSGEDSSIGQVLDDNRRKNWNMKMNYNNGHIINGTADIWRA